MSSKHIQAASHPWRSLGYVRWTNWDWSTQHKISAYVCIENLCRRLHCRLDVHSSLANGSYCRSMMLVVRHGNIWKNKDTAPNCVWRSCLAIGSCASTCACTSPAASASKRWWYVQSVQTMYTLYGTTWGHVREEASCLVERQGRLCQIKCRESGTSCGVCVCICKSTVAKKI